MRRASEELASSIMTAYLTGTTGPAARISSPTVGVD